MFFDKRNSLKLTMKKEVDEALPFIDVKIEKSTNKFLTFISAIYRKSTFMGQYIRWDSFGPSKRKIKIIGTFRALKICSESKLQEELNCIRTILRDNGYPEENIFNSSMSKKIALFQEQAKEEPQNCNVLFATSLIGK